MRSTYDRRGRAGGRELRLRRAVSKGRIRGEHRVEVRRGSLQKHPRTASLVVRTTTIVLHMSEAPTGESFELDVNVVDACEVGPIPRGAERINWRLLTNHPIDSNDEVAAVLRWRIEDLRRTWKSGACQVERMQLRSASHATRWAILLVANAARIERIKHLARNTPERPASDEFTDAEIKATRLMKRKYKKRTETISDAMPSVGQMVLWLAELGGYTGPKSSGGRPGSITIKRGLDLILPAAAMLELMRAERKKR